MKSKPKINNTSSLKTTVKHTKNSVNDIAIINVLNTLPVGVVIFSLSKILFANKPALKIFKPTASLKQNINKHSIFEFLLPEYHERIKENSLKILKGEEFKPFELKIKNPKNEIVDLEVKSNVIEFNGQKAIQTIFTDISEQVQYRNDLSTAKENLELITKNANDLIFFYTYHPKPKYLYISPVIKKILGYSPEEFYKNGNLGNEIAVDKKGYTAFDKTLNKNQKNNTFKFTNSVFQYKTKQGKLVWLEDNYSPIYNSDGQIKFILGISRDITKEKEAQLELEQKWNNYKNLLDASPIGIFIHDKICIYGNKTASKILEIDNPQKLVGKNLLTFMAPEQRERAIDRMQRALMGDELEDLTYKIKTAKGKFIDVELKTSQFIYNGKPCAQTIISNISVQKKLEKEVMRAELAEESNKSLVQEINYRKKLQNELVSQTTKYQAIFNNTSHLIWTVDRNLSITSFNTNYFNYVKKIFDFEIKVGTKITAVKSKINRKVNIEFWSSKYKTLFEEKKDNTVVFFEIENKDKFGKTHYRELYMHVTRDAKGEVNEVAVIAQDVTERKQSEQKIIAQSAKLKAIFESGQQLIWTVDKNYFFTSFNQNFSDAMLNVYGVRPTIDLKIFKPSKGKASIEYHNWWIEKYAQVFKFKKRVEFITEQIDKKGNKHFRQVFLHPIYNEAGIVYEISCTSNDVTEFKFLQEESINQAAKLSSIFESSSHLIWTVDKDFKVTSFNKNFSNVFNKFNKAEPKLNIQLHTVLPKSKQADYKNYWYSIYKRALNGESFKVEKEQVDAHGEAIYNEIYINPIRNAKNEIIEVACLAHDISDNKRYEQKIINQSAKLNAIFETGDHLIWTINTKLELTSYNKNYFNLIKNNLQRKKLKDNNIISVLNTIQNKQKKEFWIEKYNQVLKGKPTVFVHKTFINNADVYREVHLYPIFLNNKAIEVSVIAQDITERIENEKIIIEQSSKLKAIFESGEQLMWTITKDLKLTSFNKNYADAVYNLYQFYPEVGKSLRESPKYKKPKNESEWDEHYKRAFNGYKVDLTIDRINADGSQVFRQYYLYPIKDKNNNVIEVSGIGFDITEKKINEDKISQSLKEKEILLKEVHHRVKNNMQVISSILNLQSSYVKDVYALNLLKECQNRIKSMAFIHESLYQTKNFESVNFSEYVSTLTKNLVHTYSVNSQKIKLILTLDKLFLNLDMSIPCGLIINEIISNSLKYAFPDNRGGIIFVTLKSSNNKVELEAGDNGIGIPLSIDLKQSQTLGLQLVDTLVDQINGTVILDRTNGTKFKIEFKL